MQSSERCWPAWRRRPSRWRGHLRHHGRHVRHALLAGLAPCHRRHLRAASRIRRLFAGVWHHARRRPLRSLAATLLHRGRHVRRLFRPGEAGRSLHLRSGSLKLTLRPIASERVGSWRGLVLGVPLRVAPPSRQLGQITGRAPRKRGLAMLMPAAAIHTERFARFVMIGCGWRLADNLRRLIGRGDWIMQRRASLHGRRSQALVARPKRRPTIHQH